MVNKARIEHTSAEGHEGDATCVAYFGGQLFSGGADGKIRVGIPRFLALASSIHLSVPLVDLVARTAAAGHC